MIKPNCSKGPFRIVSATFFSCMILFFFYNTHSGICSVTLKSLKGSLWNFIQLGDVQTATTITLVLILIEFCPLLS